MSDRVDPLLVRRVFELEQQFSGQHAKWPKIAEIVNKEFGTDYKRDNICNVHKRYKLGYSKSDKAIPPDSKASDVVGFLDRIAEIRAEKKVSTIPNTAEWRDVFLGAQGVREKVSDRQLEATAQIKTNKPIALSFLGDFHLGSPHTDYARLYGDIDFIKQNKNLYCCISGDRTDQFTVGFKDASAVTNQLTPAELQIDAMEAIVKEIGPSIVAAIGGNHDCMIQRKVGVDVERWTRRGWGFPYMPTGGLLTLTVGAQQYKILWKHDYKFNSAFNQFNSMHRMLELLEPSADLVVTEHRHSPGMESIERGTGASAKTVISIRTGAYKTTDPFSMSFYKEGVPGPQTVILWPDKRKVLGMHGTDAMRDAVVYLKGVA